MTVKNIILINDFGSINGGISQVCIASAIGLRDLGLNVYYFCATTPIDASLEAAGVNVICLDTPDILSNPDKLNAAITGIWNVNAAEKLKDLLQNLSVSDTLVHVHAWPKALSASIFHVIRSLGFPYVYTLHDYFSACPNGGFYNYQTDSICTKQALSLDCLTTNCDVRSYPQKIWRSARQLVVKHVAKVPAKISNVIYISDLSRKVLAPYFHGDTHWFYCRNPVNVVKRERIAAEQNQYFLFVGRLSSEKGADLFAQAVTKAGYKGCVIGDGELLPDLKAKYPDVEFLGWQNSEGIRQAFLKARALVFPSKWYETLGLTVLEAQAYGIPVIVADKTAASDLVKNHVNGLLFESGRVESIVDCMHKMQDDQKLSEMSHVCYQEYWQDPPTLDHHCKNLVQIYQKIIMN